MCTRSMPAAISVQADLDETYYYKIDRPEGYALQRIYTDADSPLHAPAIRSTLR